MKITINNYKELRAYLDDETVSICARSENAKVCYVDGKEVNLPICVEDHNYDLDGFDYE